MARVIKTGKWGRARKIIPLLLFDSTRKILCQHIKEVTGDHKLHSLFETVEWEVLLDRQLQCISC